MTQEVQQTEQVNPDPNEVILLADIAKMLGVNHETARRMAIAGKIPAFQYEEGGHWRARRGEIDKFIRDRQTRRQAGQAEGANQ